MTHKVLALKFRPQQFSDIVGQEHITKTLINSIKGNRIAHAYLFTGSRGVGKTTTARILAKSLNCKEGPTINPCNQCKNCIEISKSISLDVEEIDGASNRGINEIRELKEKAQYQPINSRYKIFIIDEVHMLTNEAFNALLKILEEPPKFVIFILATTEPHKIPPTIHSRCQRFDFKRLSINEIISNMKSILEKEGYNIDDTTLFKIAKKADGSMRDALSILEQVINFYFDEDGRKYVDAFLNYIDTSFFNELIDYILKNGKEQIIEKLKELYFNGTDFKNFTQEFIQYLENLILIKNLQEKAKDYVQETPENLNEMLNLSRECPEKLLQNLLLDLINNFDKIKYSDFPHINLELLILKNFPDKSFDSKKEKIEKKEEPKKDWNEILNYFSLKKPLIYGVLAKANVLKIDLNEISIEIEKGIIDKNKIQEALKKFFKKVSIIEKEKKIPFKHEVLNHPVVNNILTIFGGEIVKIVEYNNKQKD